MVIEFNGLPGTGKTTVSHVLGQLLEASGIRCAYTYELQESKLKRYFSYLYDGSIVVAYLVKKIIDDIKPERPERNKMIFLVVKYYRMYLNYKKLCENEILIIDQGIVQALISIAYNDHITSSKGVENLFRYLKKKKITFLCVNCNTDSLLSFERIKKRNQKGGRLDVLDGQELVQILDLQKENFEMIRECIYKINGRDTSINIDTNNEPHINAEILIKGLH